jgi:hypothetical protein
MENGILTTAEAGEFLETEEWRVRRIFEDGDLPEPPKFGGKRIISRRSLPRIRAALLARGWLKDAAAARGLAVDPENANRPNEKRGRPKKPDRAA